MSLPTNTRVVLVTGASGFIGYHLAARLLAEGDTVVGLDNLNDYYDVGLKRARLERLQDHPQFSFGEIDLDDRPSLDALFGQHAFDLVVNLAAQAGVRYSLVNPHAYVKSNVSGFSKLLEACRHTEVGHLIYASSSSVYGALTQMPFSVRQNVDYPVSLYAASKKANELFAHTYSHLFRLPTTGAQTVRLQCDRTCSYISSMRRLVRIGEAATALGVHVTTLRRWEAQGRLAAEHTAGGHRQYDLAKLSPEMFRAAEKAARKTIAYARVSSHDQKDDLERQKQVLELYCARHGWTFEVVADLGSGMNYHKKGLKRLLDGIIDDEVGRLVIAHKDRLLRFGAELVFAICEAKGVEVVILNQGENTTFEEDLARDVLEIITVFSARLYGSRSRKNQRLLNGMKRVVEESAAC